MEITEEECGNRCKGKARRLDFKDCGNCSYEDWTMCGGVMQPGRGKVRQTRAATPEPDLSL